MIASVRLAALAAAVVLLVGCEDHRAPRAATVPAVAAGDTPTATPTETIEELRARLRASALPDYRPPLDPETVEMRRAACEVWATTIEQSRPTGRAALALSPPAPRPGDLFRLRGTGIGPGEYLVRVAPVGYQGAGSGPRVTVPTGGELDVTLLMPDPPEPAVCMSVGLLSSSRGPLEGRPFFVP